MSLERKIIISYLELNAGFHSAVVSVSDWGSRGCKFESQLKHINFMVIDHEIIYTVILPLHLIQEGL